MAVSRKKKKDDNDVSMAEFFTAIKLMEKEKGISAEAIYDAICNAITLAARHDYNGKDVVTCTVDEEKQQLKIVLRKNVVSEIVDPMLDLLPEEAEQYKTGAQPGDIVEVPLDPKKFGRVAAIKVKHILRQGIKDVEHGQVLKEFQSRNHEIVTARVTGIDSKSGNLVLEIGKAEAILPAGEQVPGEKFELGGLIKVYINDVRETEKGPKAMISRTHPGFINRLFEAEVPELYDGTVEIKMVCREAGSRTKIAVWSKDPNVDAIGACIGHRGARVGKIVDILGGEKIDIVKYSEDPAEFIVAALAPAEALSIEILDEEARSCRVIVPDSQLSLAIGNKGQNARLAARITGWKIDIKPESGLIDGISTDELDNLAIQEALSEAEE